MPNMYTAAQSGFNGLLKQKKGTRLGGVRKWKSDLGGAGGELEVNSILIKYIKF